MKKLLIILCALSLVFGMVGAAGATPITFTDSTIFYSDHTDPNVDLVSYGGSYVNKLEYITDWVMWTHHFTFDPEVDEVLSGTLTVMLKDDTDPWYQPFEFAFGWAEDGTWDFGEVNNGSYSYDVSASYLADGSFTIMIASVGGDFFINQSDLEITYEPIPEPATLILFGTGLIGLAGLGKKKFKK